MGLGSKLPHVVVWGVESGVFEVKDNTQVMYLKTAIYTDYNRPNKVGPPSVYCSVFFFFLFSLSPRGPGGRPTNTS